MKQLVICSKDFISEYEGVIASGEIHLNGDLVNYALIEKEDIAFDPDKMIDHVLVRKQAFSCNYREMGLIKMANAKVNKTDALTYYAIGSEFSGVVVGVGREVSRFKIGDRVMSDGSYPFTTSPTAYPGLPTNHGSNELEIIHGHKLAQMPQNMDFTTAAAFTIGAQTIYSMIDRLDIKENDRILITGIKSNTSLFALNALKHKNVILTGLSRGKVDEEFFKNLGLKNILYYSGEEEIQSLIQLKEVFDLVIEQGKFDHVIDPFGDTNLFKLLDLININGKYITCGMSDQTSPGTVSVNLSSEIGKLIVSNISIMGNCLGSSAHLNNAIEDFRNGNLDVIINDVISDDIDTFMFKSFLDKTKIGKVVFDYGSTAKQAR